MRKQKPKYVVPDRIKIRVRNFMNDFLTEQGQTKAGLATLMQEKLGRSGCRPSLVKKNVKLSAKPLTEILGFWGKFTYEEQKYIRLVNGILKFIALRGINC